MTDLPCVLCLYVSLIRPRKEKVDTPNLINGNSQSQRSGCFTFIIIVNEPSKTVITLLPPFHYSCYQPSIIWGFHSMMSINKSKSMMFRHTCKQILDLKSQSGVIKLRIEMVNYSYSGTSITNYRDCQSKIVEILS